MRRLIIDAIAFACLALVLWAGCERLSAAPRPFPRRAQARWLSRARLCGTWTMRWGNVPCPVTLSPSGDYVCVYGGTHYVGTWGIDSKNQVWLTESCNVNNPRGWRSYAIRLSPTTLSGPVVHGAPGVSVQLRRK